MFQRCLKDGEFRQAVGVAIEGRRLDIIERAVTESGDATGMLAYTFEVTMTLLPSRTFRDQIMLLLARLYRSLSVPEHSALCQCLVILDDADGVAALLRDLMSAGGRSRLVAYQLAFDLYEHARQRLRTRISTALLQSGAEGQDEQTQSSAGMDTSTDEGAASGATAASSSSSSASAEAKRIAAILGGEVTLPLYVEFLSRNNNTDPLILKSTRDVVQKQNIIHNATVIANGIMSAGTTSDAFLRENKDWLARATNWAKFTAIGSLGVIHKVREGVAWMQRGGRRE